LNINISLRIIKSIRRLLKTLETAKTAMKGKGTPRELLGAL